jgi:hypothetical protein
MSSSLRIGDRLFNSEQIISALVQYKLLDPLVGQVILDKVIQPIGLSVEEIFYSLNGSADSPIPENFNEFLTQWCQKQEVTLSYLENVLLRDLRIEKFKQVQFASQVEAEFLRVKSEFDQVEYSLMELSDLALATELYFQLRDDAADFAQMAQRYALGDERYTGGWSGLVPFSALPVEVATLFRQVEVGTICEPITIADRVYLVRLERLIPARLTEATKAQLINRMHKQWLQSQVKALIATPNAIEVLEQSVSDQLVAEQSVLEQAVPEKAVPEKAVLAQPVLEQSV